jgi:hypothetical protein
MRLEHQVGAVTKRLFVGPFLTPARAAYLRGLGVTHVLNVGEAPSVVTCAEASFSEIRDCAVTDLALIPDAVALQCVTALHDMLQNPAAKAYVHCIAGQNRSPTVLWLYMIACGMSAVEAKSLIEASAPDAVPGHKVLSDARLADLMERYGREQLRPVPMGVLDLYL